MKHITTLAFLLSFLSQVSTQTLPMKVIAAAGNQVKSGNLTLCYTLGELAIHQTTTTSPTLQYREGFWQPDICVAPDTADNATPALKLTICAGSSTTLSASGEGTISWYDAPTGGKYLGGGGQFVTPVLDSSTTFYVQDSTCTASRTRRAVLVTINTPIVDAIGDLSVCHGSLSAEIALTSTVPSAVFKWSNSTPSVGLPASGVGNVPAFQAINTGAAPIVSTITVTPEALAGTKTCIGPPKTFTITVHPLPTAQVSLPAPSITCPSPEVTLNGTPSSAGADIQYQWLASQGGNIVSGGTTPTPKVDRAGTYALTVQNTATTCLANVTVQVTGSTQPPTSIAVEAQPIRCAGESNGAIVIGPVTGGQPPYRYSLDGGAWQDSPTFGGLASGLYDLSVIGSNECEMSGGEAEVKSVEVFTAKIINDFTRLTDSSATVVTVLENAQGSVTWLWSGQGLSCTDCAEPLVQSQIPDYVYCTVTDSKGCEAIAARVYVLNTYTKPGEASIPNDIIYVNPKTGEPDPVVFPDLEKDPDRYRNNDIVIFNRWGQVVFKSAPYLNDWNGKDMNGRELPEGTYYYVLTLKDRVKKLIYGNVLLIR